MAVKLKQKIMAHTAGFLAAVLAVTTIPLALCGRGASKWMEGDVECQRELSRGVARLVFDEEVSRSRFRTGSSQFSGEWLFGTYQMAGIGFAQVAIEHPELREDHVRVGP